MTVLAADWPAPPGVTAFTTVRTGGTSTGTYDSLNLGVHVGDALDRVAQNRALVQRARGWHREPFWLDQVHGTTVVRASSASGVSRPQADGAVTSDLETPLVVVTADCLPVLACTRTGSVVGAFHAGWRGLLAGVLEEGIKSMEAALPELLVWIGPAIGPDSYQVGPEVRQAYLASDPAHDQEFSPDGPGHWKFDLAGAAVRRLNALGVASVTRSRWDTYRDQDLFFSHRRQGTCGRLGTFICLERSAHE